MGDFVHSQQLRFDKSHISCGVLEVHHLPDWSGGKLAFSIATALYHKANPRPTAFVIWSDVVERADSRGMRLAEFFGGKDFGLMWESPQQVNPKTGNVIRMWVLTVNHETFRLFYQQELANRIEED